MVVIALPSSPCQAAWESLNHPSGIEITPWSSAWTHTNVSPADFIRSREAVLRTVEAWTAASDTNFRAGIASILGANRNLKWFVPCIHPLWRVTETLSVSITLSGCGHDFATFLHIFLKWPCWWHAWCFALMNGFFSPYILLAQQ